MLVNLEESCKRYGDAKEVVDSYLEMAGPNDPLYDVMLAKAKNFEMLAQGQKTLPTLLKLLGKSYRVAWIRARARRESEEYCRCSAEGISPKPCSLMGRSEKLLILAVTS